MDNLPPLNPFVKPYYKDGQGSKSIGEPEWRPHPKNALSVPNRLNNSVRYGYQSLCFLFLVELSMKRFLRIPKQQQQQHYKKQNNNQK